MKLLTTEQTREADRYTISHEPIESVDLMERAAAKCATWLLSKMEAGRPVYIFCGTGNNGGDGLALARLLAMKRRSVVVYVVRFSAKTSADFDVNYGRLVKNPRVAVHEYTEGMEFPAIPENALVVDALFGSGLNKPVGGWVADLIQHVNAVSPETIAIDIPSGLFGEDNSDNDGAIIRAATTLTFQFPKLSFLFAENGAYTGDWVVLPIVLHPDFIAAAPSKNYFIQLEDCRSMVKSRQRFSHKGTYGHALLIAGSYGKTGAAVLAARAALRAGAGLVTAHVPRSSYAIMQTAVPEVMASVDSDENRFSEFPGLSVFTAIAAGPGTGTDPVTQHALKLLIQESNLPLILDADALNILSENKTWLAFLTPNTILTPHPGEFERLAGPCRNGWERWQRQVEFSRKYHVYVVLKGAFTSVTCPDGSAFFNSTGNPGMASAGSGDVLTGILLGLKAQGYNSAETCILGVFLHGLAGDIAAGKTGQHALMAGDITGFMGKAWRYIIRP